MTKIIMFRTGLMRSWWKPGRDNDPYLNLNWLIFKDIQDYLINPSFYFSSWEEILLPLQGVRSFNQGVRKQGDTFGQVLVRGSENRVIRLAKFNQRVRIQTVKFGQVLIRGSEYRMSSLAKFNQGVRIQDDKFGQVLIRGSEYRMTKELSLCHKFCFSKFHWRRP